MNSICRREGLWSNFRGSFYDYLILLDLKMFLLILKLMEKAGGI